MVLIMPRRQRSPFNKFLAQFMNSSLLPSISYILNGHRGNPVINFPFPSFLKRMSESGGSTHGLLFQGPNSRPPSLIFRVLNIRPPLSTLLMTTLSFKPFNTTFHQQPVKQKHHQQFNPLTHTHTPINHHNIHKKQSRKYLI